MTFRHFKLTLLILSLVLAILAAKPLYHQIKTMRAVFLLNQAKDLLEEEKNWECLQKVQVAYRLDPANPDALRLFAQSYEISFPWLAQNYWKKVIQHPKATLSDHHSTIRLLLRLNLFNEADFLLTQILKKDPRNIQTLLLCARYELLTGNLKSTLEFCSRAQQLDPQNEKTHLFIGQLFLASHQDKIFTEGKRILFEILDSDNKKISLTALLRLMESTRLSEDEITKLITKTKQHPLSSPKHYLKAQTCLLRHISQSSQRDLIIQETIDTYQENHLVPLTQWLNANQEHLKTLELISEEKALSNTALLTSYVQAMELSTRHQDILSFLQKKENEVPLPKMNFEVLLARLEHHLGNRKQATLHWNRAIAEAADHELLFVLRFMQQLGYGKKAIPHYERFAKRPTLWNQGFVKNYLSLLQSEGETQKMRDLMKQGIQYFPDNPVFQHNYAYLNLLLDENLAESHRILSEIDKKFPQGTLFKPACILSYLQQGLIAKATQTFEQIPNNHPFSDSDQVIIAYLYSNLEDSQKTNSILSSINTSTLLPEEKELLLLIETKSNLK